MKKTVLVTGGLGFIGSNLVRKLLAESDHQIIILDKVTYSGRLENFPKDPQARKRVKLIVGNVTKRSDVEEAVKKATIVVHLAANTNAFHSLTEAAPFVRTNTLGTTIVLESVEKFPVERLVLASSSEIYGNQQDGIEMDENHPYNPVSPYAASKLAADRMAYSFYLTKQLPVTILRPFNTYGAFQHPEKMIPRFLTRLLKDLPITLNNGGYQLRDWIYVEDHASAIQTVIEAPLDKVKGETFNVGTGIATPVRDVAQLIIRALGKDRSFVKIMPSTQPETKGNVGISKKAERVLGWKAKISLEEGIPKTAGWYKANRKWWGPLVDY